MSKCITIIFLILDVSLPAVMMNAQKPVPVKPRILTVSKWRNDVLLDWAKRWEWLY